MDPCARIKPVRQAVLCLNESSRSIAVASPTGNAEQQEPLLERQASLRAQGVGCRRFQGFRSRGQAV